MSAELPHAAQSDSGRSRHRRVVVYVLLASLAFAGIWFAWPTDPERLVREGLTIGRRDPAAGERLIRRAISQSPESAANARLALTWLLARQDRWEVAATEFAAIDASQCDSRLLLDLAKAAFQAGQPKLALASLQSLRTTPPPGNISALELLYDWHSAWGPEDEQLRAATELTNADPENFERWKTLISILRLLHREADCLDAIRRALQIDWSDEEDSALRHQLIQQLLVTGDAPQARTELEALGQAERDSFRVRTYEVDLLRLEGLPEQALELLTSIFPQVEGQPQAYLNRGILYLDLRRYADAAADFERALVRDPMNATVHFKLSEACRALGRSEAATRERRIAVEISDKRTRIESLRKEAGKGHDDLSRFREIARLHRELKEQGPAQAWDARADSLEGL